MLLFFFLLQWKGASFSSVFMSAQLNMCAVSLFPYFLREMLEKRSFWQEKNLCEK